MSDDRSLAFERLLADYQDKVFRLAWSILRDDAAAEDAAQEAFLRAWKNWDSFRGESHRATWLYSIARNVALTMAERRGREAEGKMPEIAVAPAPVSYLWRHVARLPEPYRQVLTLYYFEERSYAEVAEMLGTPLGTVKAQLHRARKELALRMQAVS